MRRTIPYAVAVVATVVAVLGVMVGVGIGQTISSHGGTPSDVYTQTFPGDSCADAELNPDETTVFGQEITFEAESNVVVYFSFEFGFEIPRQEALISFGLDETRVGEWGVAAPGSTTAKFYGTRQSGTLMWTFDHVGTGVHLFRAFARVSTGVAGMNSCAFTVLVSPVVE